MKGNTVFARKARIGYLVTGVAIFLIVINLIIKLVSEHSNFVPGMSTGVLILIVGIWSTRTPAAVIDQAGIKLNLALINRPYIQIAELKRVDVTHKYAILETSKKKHKFPLSLLDDQNQRIFVERLKSLLESEEVIPL